MFGIRADFTSDMKKAGNQIRASNRNLRFKNELLFMIIIVIATINEII